MECYKATYLTSDLFDGNIEWLAGIPEFGKEQLESGIIKGNITYEELCAGDKVIIDKRMLYWYPHIKIGDIIDVIVEDGRGSHKRKLEIAAIGDYHLGFTGNTFIIMAEKGLESFSDNNLNFYYHIFSKENYDEEVEAKLKAIVEESGRIEMRAWKDIYDEYKSSLAMTRGMCYMFLGILGAICIMNMINTMIYNVHVRKKEIGILQALGMSDIQMKKMLRLEGLFYAAGTLIVAVGGGSLAGYPVFLLAKEKNLLNISNYHYPAKAAVAVILVLVTVQFALILALGKSVKKESLIARIRYSN